jgi:hypothetical protein
LKIGYINIGADRKLYFTNAKDYTGLPDALENQNRSLQAPLNIAKSNGPRSTMSHMTNSTTRRSVRTPMTNCGTSVASRAHSSKWSFFKNNNPQNDVESRKSKHSTVKSKSRRSVGSESASNQTMDRNGEVPYSHLAKFIKRHTDYRFGKRMGRALNLNDKSVMHEQLEQIQEKNYKKLEDKLQKRDEDLRGYLSLVNDIDRDQKEREIEIVQQRREFLRGIENLKQQKVMKAQLEQTNSRDYEYSYFPFTHGDNIERQRRDIADKLKHEMQEHYKHKKTTFMGDAVTNKSTTRAPLSYSTISEKGDVDVVNKRSMSTGYDPNSTDGVFFKPHKSHYLRHVYDEQQEDTNKKALKRHELELMKQKLKRQQMEAQFKMNQDDIVDVKNEELERKRRQIESTRQGLDEQYKEKKRKRELEFYEKKKYHNTHFGPEETDNVKELFHNKRELEKNVLNQELNTQMANKRMVKETDIMLGKEVASLHNKQAQNMLETEKKDGLLKKKQQIEKNVSAWADQKNVKLNLDKIDKI